MDPYGGTCTSTAVPGLEPRDIANSTIGRAIALIVKNVGGARKGVEDMGTFGNPGKYSMVLAENEEENPWEPLHVEQGFAPEDSAITVSFPNCFWTLMPPGGTDDESLLRTIDQSLIPSTAGQSSDKNVLLLPAHAKTLAALGWSRRAIADFINDHARGGGGRLQDHNGREGRRPDHSLRWPRQLDSPYQRGTGIDQKIELPTNWAKLVENKERGAHLCPY